MSNIVEPRAVAVARAHPEARSRHDYEAARKALAPHVKVNVLTTVPGLQSIEAVGVEDYMKGLIEFGYLIVPGSLIVLNALGDEDNALLTLTVTVTGGPFGDAKLPLWSARNYLINKAGKIAVDQVIFFIGA